MHASPPSTTGKRLHNLFLALQPAPEVAARIGTTAAALRAGSGAGGRWLRMDRYHLTLHFLAAFPCAPPTELLARVRRAAAGVEVAAFDLQLDRCRHFGGSTCVLWLGPAQPAADLLRLHAALGAQLGREGVTVDLERPFVPHVSIAREVIEPMAAVAIEPVHWLVSDFVLIDSRLGAAPEHRVLGRWPLAAG